MTADAANTTDSSEPEVFFTDQGEVTQESLTALRSGAALATVNVAVIEVTGPGALQCLQGLLTCDLEAAGNASFQYGALLTPKGMIVTDMPFMSYQVSPEEALRNAGRLVQEGNAQAVKLEGGAAFRPTIEAIVAAGIPVMGHIGLLPQSVHQLGGYRVQGRDAAGARKLLHDAQVLQEAGCFALVLEAIPLLVAQEITASLQIPTIGIGAGPHCDGQVLVLHDLLGLAAGGTPKFVRRYADLTLMAQKALEAYVHDVRTGRFPDRDHSYGG